MPMRKEEVKQPLQALAKRAPSKHACRGEKMGMSLRYHVRFIASLRHVQRAMRPQVSGAGRLREAQG